MMSPKILFTFLFSINSIHSAFAQEFEVKSQLALKANEYGHSFDDVAEDKRCRLWFIGEVHPNTIDNLESNIRLGYFDGDEISYFPILANNDNKLHKAKLVLQQNGTIIIFIRDPGLLIEFDRETFTQMQIHKFSQSVNVTTMVWQGEYNRGQGIYISELARGFYIVVIEGEKGMKTKKFV